MTETQRHIWTNPFRRASLATQVLNAWRATPLLEGVPGRVSAQLTRLTHVRQYQGGEFVFREGDSAVAAALIIKGAVIIRSGEHDIARLEAGEFFGEAALLDETPRSASAIAEPGSVISLLVRYQFEEFVRHRPQAGLGIMTNLAQLLLARLKKRNHDDDTDTSASPPDNTLTKAVVEAPVNTGIHADVKAKTKSHETLT